MKFDWSKFGKALAVIGSAAAVTVATNPEPIAAAIPSEQGRTAFIASVAVLNLFLPALTAKKPAPPEAK